MAVATLLSAAPLASAMYYDGFGVPVTLNPGVSYSNFDDEVVAVNYLGDAIAAWTYYDPNLGLSTVQSSIYTTDAGWGVPQNHLGYAADSTTPAVAALSDGSLLLAYRDSGDGGATRPYIWAQIWNPNSGWAPGQTISSGSSWDLSRVKAGADGVGNAFVVWLDNNQTINNVTANRYAAGSGWLGAPLTLDTASATAADIGLAVGQSGAALVTWRATVSADPNVYASRYVPGSGFQAPETVDTSTSAVAGGVLFPAVSVNGDLAVTWAQHDGTTFRVWGSFYSQGAWSTPFRINAGAVALTSVPLMLVPTSDGALVAVYVDAGAGWNAINWSRLSGGVWSAPARFLPTDVSSYGSMFAVSDGAGGLAVGYTYYSETTGQDSFMVSSFAPAYGLIQGRPLGEYRPLYEYPVAAGTNARGSAVFLFHENNGDHSLLRATYYERPDRTAPEISAYVLGGNVTKDATAVVEGTGSLEAGITVNGVQAEYVDFGIWNARVPLHPGNNSLEVIARDAAGNFNRTVLYVDYQDPVPGLQAQLAASQAALATTQANLATAQHDLSVAQGQISALQAAQAGLQTNSTADNATQAARLTAVENSAGGGAGTLLGVLGILIGLAAIGMAVMMGRKGKSAPVPPSPKEEPKPAEPPKTP